MSLFNAGIAPALDNNGDPISGATWTFYASGTSDAITAYSSGNLSTPLGSSIESNSAGLFPLVYLNGSNATRAILRDDAGTVLRDIDPVETNIASVPASAVSTFRNTDMTGYSGVHFLTNAGGIAGHIGYANVNATNFAGSVYLGSITPIPVHVTVGNARAASFDSAAVLHVSPYFIGGSGRLRVLEGGGYAISTFGLGNYNAAQFVRRVSGTDTEQGVISISDTGTIYGTTSDYRLKKDLKPLAKPWLYINSLNPYEGLWDVNDKPFVGFVAHEVQEASRTNFVTGEKDGEKMQTVDYSSGEIIASMVAALQDADKRMKSLERSNKTLKARLAELEAR